MEAWATKIFFWVGSQYPVVGLVIGAIVIIYTAAKAVIALTPSKEDDKMLERFQKTWLGKTFEFLIKNPIKKIKKLVF